MSSITPSKELMKILRWTKLWFLPDRFKFKPINALLIAILSIQCPSNRTNATYIFLGFCLQVFCQAWTVFTPQRGYLQFHYTLLFALFVSLRIQNTCLRFSPPLEMRPTKRGNRGHWRQSPTWTEPTSAPHCCSLREDWGTCSHRCNNIVYQQAPE